ncbi:hypothetical protein ACHAWF_007420 [Thalassiosira exigua]
MDGHHATAICEGSSNLHHELLRIEINFGTNATFLRHNSTKQKFIHYDPEELIAALEILMQNNIFHFGDLYLMNDKEEDIIPTYTLKLLIFVWYINDVFGIWIQIQLGFGFL